MRMSLLRGRMAWRMKEFCWGVCYRRHTTRGTRRDDPPWQGVVLSYTQVNRGKPEEHRISGVVRFAMRNSQGRVTRFFCTHRLSRRRIIGLTVCSVIFDAFARRVPQGAQVYGAAIRDYSRQNNNDVKASMMSGCGLGDGHVVVTGQPESIQHHQRPGSSFLLLAVVP